MEEELMNSNERAIDSQSVTARNFTETDCKV